MLAFLDGRRQRHREARAESAPFAFRRDLAVMQLDDVPLMLGHDVAPVLDGANGRHLREQALQRPEVENVPR